MYLLSGRSILVVVLQISPSYVRAHYELGTTLLAEGKAEAALEEMQKETPDGGRDAGLLPCAPDSPEGRTSSAGYFPPRFRESRRGGAHSLKARVSAPWPLLIGPQKIERKSQPRGSATSTVPFDTRSMRRSASFACHQLQR
jgi:hypothetical protein